MQMILYFYIKNVNLYEFCSNLNFSDLSAAFLALCIGAFTAPATLMAEVLFNEILLPLRV